jgi:hypothetical protein
LPAIVAVTEQSPAELFDKAPDVIEQLAPVTEYDTEPAVEPPLVVNVSAEPYVPEVEVTDNAD